MRFLNEKEFVEYYYSGHKVVDVQSYYPMCGVFRFSESHLKERISQLTAWHSNLSSKMTLKGKVAEFSKRLEQEPACFKMLGDNKFLTAVWFLELQDQKVILFLSNKGFNVYLPANLKIKDVFAVINELLSIGDFS